MKDGSVNALDGKFLVMCDTKGVGTSCEIFVGIVSSEFQPVKEGHFVSEGQACADTKMRSNS